MEYRLGSTPVEPNRVVMLAQHLRRWTQYRCTASGTVMLLYTLFPSQVQEKKLNTKIPNHNQDCNKPLCIIIYYFYHFSFELTLVLVVVSDILFCDYQRKTTKSNVFCSMQQQIRPNILHSLPLDVKGYFNGEQSQLC